MPTSSARISRELSALVRGRHTLVVVRTSEDDHAARIVREVSIDCGAALVAWTAVRGVHEGLTEDGDAIPGTENAAAALQHLLSAPDARDDSMPLVALMLDLGPHLSDPRTARALRELVHAWHGRNRHIVLVESSGELPGSIGALATTIELPLPDEAEIDRIVRATIRDLARRARIEAMVSDADLRVIVRNLAGLTRRQVEQIVVDASLDDGRFGISDLPLILERKRRVLSASGVLEFVETPASLDEVGGLRALKRWIALRGKAFDERAAAFGLKPPRGVLILGVQGTGKSLSAKAIAAAWKRPLARLDPGRLYDKFVGESERNLREALKQAEAMAPVVLWIDEIEKGFASAASQSVDGGLSKRMFGTLLTWMQEHRSHVFLVATANDIEALPPELLRKGRFDEIFFVDLPSDEVRRELFAIHIRRRGRDPGSMDLGRLAAATAGYSPAEVEHAVEAALHEAFDAGGALTTDMIERAARRSPPLSVTARERVQELREWARERCVMADDANGDA